MGPAPSSANIKPPLPLVLKNSISFSNSIINAVVYITGFQSNNHFVNICVLHACIMLIKQQVLYNLESIENWSY